MRRLETFATLFDRVAAISRFSAIAPRAVAVLVAALVVTGSALGPATALAVAIDGFTETTTIGFDVTAPSLTSHFASGLTSVAGGDRTIELVVTAATGLANNVAFAIDPSGEGKAMYASGPLADGDLSLYYDGPDLSSDLGGTVGTVEVDFVAFDDGFNLGMDVTVIVSDGVDFAELTIPITGSSLAPFQLAFQLASFSGIGAVDTSSLASIEVLFEAMQSQDFVLDSIHAVPPVPEPASLTLLGLGAAIAIGAYRLRRRG